MSGKPNDPLAQLSRLAVPEPDAEIRRATIAASREAFARAKAPQAKRSWSTRALGFLNAPRQWLAPVRVAAFGLVAAVAILPDFMATVPDLTVQPATEMAAPAPAPAPIEDVPAVAAEQTAPVEVLKRRAPPMAITRAPSMALAPSIGSTMAVFEGDGVQIGTQVDGVTVKIYRLDDGVETLLETRSLTAGVIRVTAAVQIVPSEDGADVVAIETLDRSGSHWDAYVDGVHSADLSAVIADATTPAEVERRLEGLP